MLILSDILDDQIVPDNSLPQTEQTKKVAHVKRFSKDKGSIPEKTSKLLMAIEPSPNLVNEVLNAFMDESKPRDSQIMYVKK